MAETSRGQQIAPGGVALGGVVLSGGVLDGGVLGSGALCGGVLGGGSTLGGGGARDLLVGQAEPSVDGERRAQIQVRVQRRHPRAVEEGHVGV